MEDLDLLKKEIENYVQEKNIQLLTGVSLNNKGSILFFNDFKQLINIAIEKNIKNLFFDTNIFKEENFEELKEILEEEKITELKLKYSSYFNKISYIQLFFINEGFTFLFSKSSDWFEEYNEDSREETDDNQEEVKCKDCDNLVHSFSVERGEEYCFVCLDKKKKEGEIKIKEMSKILMEDKEFNNCKNEMERKIYLEEKYPDLADNRFFNINILSDRTRALINMKKRDSS